MHYLTHRAYSPIGGNLHVILRGEPPMPPKDADLAFKIDFERGHGDPRRVFDSASLLIDAFEELDIAITGSVDGKIQTMMVLEDIEASSLKVYLRNLLNRVDDEAIKTLDWKRAVGAALHKAKYIALEFLDSGADGRVAVDKLREELRSVARDTDVKYLPDYSPIHEGRLIASLDKIQSAKRTLGPKDKLTVETDQRTYEVDLTKTKNPSESISLPADAKETQSFGEIILTIRKPDFLRDTLWQFSFGKTSVSAPIKDEQWLADFHARKIPLYSGDALKCSVSFKYIYDDTGALIETKIEVLKVLDVIKGGAQQYPLFDDR